MHGLAVIPLLCLLSAVGAVTWLARTACRKAYVCYRRHALRRDVAWVRIPKVHRSG